MTLLGQRAPVRAFDAASDRVAVVARLRVRALAVRALATRR